MDPRSDPRIEAFGDYVKEAHALWHQFDRALAAEIEAIDADQRLANPKKGDNVHYLNEIRTARSWPSADASPREINLHLSEVWRSVETAIGESDLIRSERHDPSPWLVNRFEARQRRERLATKFFPRRQHHSTPRTPGCSS